jgi:hypothetical protein
LQYPDATNLDELKTLLSDVNGRWSYLQQLYGHVYWLIRFSPIRPCTCTVCRGKAGSLRRLAAAAPASGAASGAAATCRADDAPVVRSVLGECARALSTVAEAADADAAKLKGLQEYVQGVLPVAPVTPVAPVAPVQPITRQP